MKDNSIFIILLALMGICFSACSGDTPARRADETKHGLSVDDASHLYFKNMRAYYYDEQTGPAEGTNLYRLRKFSPKPTNPMLIPVIVDNWLRDEAYLLVEPNDYTDGFAEPLTIAYLEGMDTVRLQLQSPSMPGQIKFVRQMAPLLEAKQDLLVRTAADRWVPIFGDSRDRLHFLTTLRDYDRLVQFEN